MKLILLLAIALSLVAADWPPPQAPAIKDADGYVAIPDVRLPPSKTTTYRAVFDATRTAAEPKELLPAINMAASELNALATVGLPLSNARFALVFHGAAVDGILDNEHYRTKFDTDNPNLRVLTEMKKQGVEFFVCGQYLSAGKIDPKTLSRDVTVAADALLVLIQYQNKGYELLSF